MYQTSSAYMGAAKDTTLIPHPPIQKQRADPFGGGFLAKRPVSTEDRLILQFYPGDACSTGKGFIDDDIRQVPKALAHRGVTEIEWREFTDKLQNRVQSNSNSIFCVIVSIISIVFIPYVCVVQGRYHKELRQWLDELNNKVLRPRRMYAKFQTNAIHTKDYHEENSWLAVALTYEECTILENEPIFWSPGCCNDKIEPSCCPDSCATCCCVPRVL
jgi:hypothetical protein